MATGPHLLQQRLGKSLGDAELDAVGDERDECGQDPYAQQLRGTGQVHRRGERAGPLQTAQRVERGGQPARHLVGVRRGLHASGQPGEQLAAGLLFQSADLRGHGGLGEPEPRRRRRERPGPVHRQKGPQQVEVRVLRELSATGSRGRDRGMRPVLHGLQPNRAVHRHPDTGNRLPYW
ncbi:hypothetical protein GCM10011578_014550 [Streptomyces fuscichromogenes]|uniref:Uncharacterized protein n=1 Tax=Streptomyces fuscichromogenes TaxID=1324013 RepID=A0A917UKG5_9ACTN|nr:hypothetical protein GCM10011578_014550 [Streptomyces fuscichromogenes]